MLKIVPQGLNSYKLSAVLVACDLSAASPCCCGELCPLYTVVLYKQHKVSLVPGFLTLDLTLLILLHKGCQQIHHTLVQLTSVTFQAGHAVELTPALQWAACYQSQCYAAKLQKSYVLEEM